MNTGVLIGLGALAYYLLGRRAPAPDGLPSSETPASAPPSEPRLSLTSPSYQSDVAAWIAATRQGLSLAGPAVAAGATITRLAFSESSPPSSPSVGATGGTVVKEAVPGESDAWDFGPGSLDELLTPTPRNFTPADANLAATAEYGDALPDRLGPADADLAAQAEYGDAGPPASGSVLGGAMAGLGAVTAGLSIYGDVASAREDWQKAALVGLDSAKLASSTTALYGIIAEETAATTIVSSAAPYLGAAAAAVALGFDIASGMPDEQKAVAAWVDTSAMAAAFIPVYGWIVSAVLLISKMFVMPLLFPEDRHAEREALEAQRVYGAAGGLLPAIPAALTPTDLWAVLTDWTSRELAGPSRLAVRYQNHGPEVTIGAGGSAYDLVAADPTTITATVSAGVRPEMLTAASDALTHTLSAHVARLAGAIRGEPQPLRELVALYRRAHPDYLLSPITATQDAEVPLLAEVVRSQFYNAIAHLFDAADWQQFLAEKLTDEWARYIAAVAQGERRPLMLFLGYPDVIALRAAVFEGRIGRGRTDPELPGLLAEIRTRRALLPPLLAELEQQERGVDAHAPGLRAEALNAGDAGPGGTATGTGTPGSDSGGNAAE